MIRTSVFGVVVLVATLISGLPDTRPVGYAPPPVSYNKPPTYGEPQCYPKVHTETMTKDVQAKEQHYGTKYKKDEKTIYASITETVVAPKTVILYSTMTAYAEPEIKTETKLLYDTKMATSHNYHEETKYGYTTADVYFKETEAVYVTKQETQKYPLTNHVTNVNIKTNAYYVTQTKIVQEYETITITNPYYVTKYEQKVVQQTEYHTNTATVQQYHTKTEWVEVPEYHTVTKCDDRTGGSYPPNGPTAYPRPPVYPSPPVTYPNPPVVVGGYPRKPSKGYGY